MSEIKNIKTEAEIRAAQHPAHQHTNVQPSSENSMSSTAQDLVSKISALRLPDNYTTHIGGETLPLKPVFGKFSKHRFARVHPGKDFMFPCLVVENKELGETYIVTPNMQAYLGSHAVPKVLRLSVDTTGLPKVIAQPIIDKSGRPNTWQTSLIHGIKVAEENWARFEANMGAAQYNITISKDDLGDPQWPDQTMDEIVQEVFSNNIISDENHPYIRQIQGRI
jgi:hypothetical protein